jgi:hypothetical protein
VNPRIDEALEMCDHEDSQSKCGQGVVGSGLLDLAMSKWDEKVEQRGKENSDKGNDAMTSVPIVVILGQLWQLQCWRQRCWGWQDVAWLPSSSSSSSVHRKSS